MKPVAYTLPPSCFRHVLMIPDLVARAEASPEYLGSLVVASYSEHFRTRNPL